MHRKPLPVSRLQVKALTLRQFILRNGLQVRARVLDPSIRVLHEQRATLDLPANCYREAFELPKIANLPAVYFVRLDLMDMAGRRIADNFYWFPAQKGGSMQNLRELPPVKLEARCKLQRHGGEMLAKVKVRNPSDHLAFFVQLALTKGAGGPEILPVLWDDNYFSLLPGESREIAARFVPKDADGAKPTLEIGGWNIEGNFACSALGCASGAMPSQPGRIAPISSPQQPRRCAGSWWNAPADAAL